MKKREKINIGHVHKNERANLCNMTIMRDASLPLYGASAVSNMPLGMP